MVYLDLVQSHYRQAARRRWRRRCRTAVEALGWTVVGALIGYFLYVAF
jgi:hypothetical protein